MRDVSHVQQGKYSPRKLKVVNVSHLSSGTDLPVLDSLIAVTVKSGMCTLIVVFVRSISIGLEINVRIFLLVGMGNV